MTFLRQFDIAFLLDQNLFTKINEQFFQFVEVLCQRIDKIKSFKAGSTDLVQQEHKTQVSLAYYSVSTVLAFLELGSSQNSPHHSLFVSLNSELFNLVYTTKNYVKSLITSSLDALHEFPAKYLLSDYPYSPRFSIKGISVSYIINDIKKKIDSWAVEYKDLLVSSPQAERDLLSGHLEMLSRAVLQVCLVTRLLSEQHADYLTNDNLALVDVLKRVCSKDVIAAHSELLYLLCLFSESY